MAERRKKAELSPDPLVESLVPEGGNPPSAIVLEGFLGQSDREGHRRLYVDPSLSTYLDIPEDEIVHSRKAGEDSRLGTSTLLWVRRSAEIEQTVVDSRRVQADFLAGDITSWYIAGTAGASAPVSPAGAAGLHGIPALTFSLACGGGGGGGGGGGPIGGGGGGGGGGGPVTSQCPAPPPTSLGLPCNPLPVFTSPAAGCRTPNCQAPMSSVGTACNPLPEFTTRGPRCRDV
jgi:hypothetical protein